VWGCAKKPDLCITDLEHQVDDKLVTHWKNTKWWNKSPSCHHTIEDTQHLIVCLGDSWQVVFLAMQTEKMK